VSKGGREEKGASFKKARKERRGKEKNESDEEEKKGTEFQ